MAILAHRIYGNGEIPVYILHGIFGMKDNWHYIAGLLSDTCTVITVDARNHGKSFHDFEMSYTIMADDLCGLMDELGHDRAWVIGHSMGGKTAMKFSAMYPERLLGLAVVDIALKQYKPSHEPYFHAFENIDFSTVQSRGEAEQLLMPYAHDATVRLFLLKNLEPMPGGGYKPRFNLAAIRQFYHESIGALSLPHPAYTGKVLFLSGSESQYITAADHRDILSAFPNAVFREVAGAGHWVHADQPAQFLAEIRHFIG